MQKLMLATEAGTANLDGAPGFTPGFQQGSCYSIFSFVYILQIVVCPVVLFLLDIVLSVLLRYTDSDWYLQTLHDTNMAEHCSKNFEPIQNIDVTLLIFSSFQTNHRICNISNTRWAISGARSMYPFRALYFTPRFCCCIPFAKSLVFSVVLYRSLSVFFFILFLWLLMFSNFSLTPIFTGVKAIGTRI